MELLLREDLRVLAASLRITVLLRFCESLASRSVYGPG